MQLEIHPLNQRQSTGNSDLYTEPDFKINAIIVKVTAISLNVLGNIVFKLQHSIDGSDWVDVPNAVTGNITSTGTTTISVDPSFACFDNMRFAWTFSNANSVTFQGSALGTK